MELRLYRLTLLPLAVVLKPTVLLAFCLLVPRELLADSSVGGEEYLAVAEAVEPNILFLIDMSENMLDPCPTSSDSSDTGEDTGTGDTASGSASTTPCIDEVADAIDQITQHFDWARFGVAGTASSEDYDGYTAIAPLGCSNAQVSAIVADLTANSIDTRNLAESLADLADNYFTITSSGDGYDDDGDGCEADWTDAPIQYWCQETHIIVITVDRPEDDEDVISGYAPTLTLDCMCDQEELTVTRDDEECLYDNVVYSLYNSDFNASLSDTQNIVVHTVAIGLDTDTVAEFLFGNAADQTDGEGIYSIADSGDELLTSLMVILSDIRSGFYSRSAPVLSAAGDYLIYSFYEIGWDEIYGGSPLAKGYVRAYQIDDDPTSDQYGQIDYLSGGDYDLWGGAIWDAGWLLSSRIVTPSEMNPDDRDGSGRRDIYTFVDEMMATSMSSEGTASRRMSYDYSFSTALVGHSDVLDLFMDTTLDGTCAKEYDTYDLNDDCLVDSTDYQKFIDFVRGYNLSYFKYLDQMRGYWKLGDSPHSVPVVVSARNNSYTVDPTYRKFLDNLEKDEVPSMVFIAANDGMLHAFFLEDLLTSSHSDEGEESWAWIPSYLLYREHDAEWAGHLYDQILYGRTFLFDGSPVVEDVWLDDDGDGSKAEDGSEWHRVIVVQQGNGGPVTLALDISDPQAPEYLWEQVDERDSTAIGYTVSRPVIANVYDTSDSTDPRDRWVAIWASGRAVPYSTSTSYYTATEANLYMWALTDDYWTSPSSSRFVGFSSDGTETWTEGSGALMNQGGSNGHPEAGIFGSSLDSDSDSRYEYAYISAPLTVIDVDSDGDADTIYFPVSATYDSAPTDPADIADPGQTWIWKALIDSTDPDDIQWCDDPFYDPDDYIGTRPAVYYAITASWFSDGTLGLYWGSGTPYERSTGDLGYFFAVQDMDPTSCTTAVPLTCNSLEGYYALDDGEGLTADPIVYGGVVYFTTYVPDADQCELGDGRLYGLDYEDCSAGMDTNGDGVVDTDDSAYQSLGEGYPSQATVSEQGVVFVGMSNPTVDGSAAAVNAIDTATDPFMGTATISWMEIY